MIKEVRLFFNSLYIPIGYFLHIKKIFFIGLYFICCLLVSLLQVDTAGWLERTNQEKGPAKLSIVQSRKNLMRAHVVALVLDAEEV